MTITYRTTGAWGIGLGADLSASQIDNNFWDLHGRIEILEAWPTPAAIEDFVVTGNQMTVLMDDYTTFGPYTLPFYVPSAFIWEPDLYVIPGQMFSINSTIYTVKFAHTTVDPFDPAENDGLGNDYYQEFITVDGVLPAGGAAGMSLVKSSSTDYAVTWAFSNVPTGGAVGDVLVKTGAADYANDWQPFEMDDLSNVTVSDVEHGQFPRFNVETELFRPARDALPQNASTDAMSLTTDHLERYLRFTHTSGCTITVRSAADTDYWRSGTLIASSGQEIHFRQEGGPITLVADTGVTINGISGYSNSTIVLGAVMTLKYVGYNEWDLFGMLAPTDVVES